MQIHTFNLYATFRTTASPLIVIKYCTETKRDFFSSRMPFYTRLRQFCCSCHGDYKNVNSESTGTNECQKTCPGIITTLVVITLTSYTHSIDNID